MAAEEECPDDGGELKGVCSASRKPIPAQWGGCKCEQDWALLGRQMGSVLNVGKVPCDDYPHCVGNLDCGQAVGHGRDNVHCSKAALDLDCGDCYTFKQGMVASACASVPLGRRWRGGGADILERAVAKSLWSRSTLKM